MKKKILLSLTLLFTIMLFGCQSKTDTELGTTFISYRINPEVGIFVSNKDEVLDTIALNDDADVLLANIDLVGKDISEASEIIISESIKTGFIDSDSMDTEVFIDVESEDEDEIKEVLEKVKKKIDDYFVNNGIFGAVSKDTLEKYVVEAQQLNLPVGQTKMVLLALELNPELSIEDVKDLKVNELVKLCHKNAKEKNFGHALGQEYKERMLALKEKYSEMFVLKGEIEVLEEKLSDENIINLTEEEISALEQELNEKETLYNALKEEYNKEKDSLKQEFKDKRATIKEELKAEKNKKEKDNLLDNQNHKGSFDKNKDQIKVSVKEFQDLKTEYKEALSTLKAEYNFSELEKIIEELEAKLEDDTLLEEEILEINEDIIKNEAILKTMEDEFKVKSADLLAQFNASKEEIKEKINSKKRG